MVTLKQHQSSYSIKQEQQQIYDRLLYCVKLESPDEVLERFNNLFIRATGYKDNRIRQALDNIIELPNIELEFPPFFNRCCQVIRKFASSI